MSDASILEGLTMREREVLALIGQGLTSVEIAERLHRSEKTIRSHRFSIGRKLGLRNRVELTRAAIQAGLVTLGEPDPVDDLRNERWDRILDAIESALSVDEQTSFFQVMTDKLALALDVRCAAIGEFVGGDTPHTLRVVAMSKGSQIDGDGEMPLDKSPCRLCLELTTVVVEKDAHKHLPEVKNVVDFNPQCYLGVVLRAEDQTPIGSLCILDDKPLDGRLHPSRVLRICAARAAAELDRRRRDGQR